MKHTDRIREAIGDICFCADTASVNEHARVALSALSAHEAEDLEREAVLAELVGTLVGIRACAKIDGRPEWLTVAEQIDATLNKVKP